jgi:hypothetical protein
LPVAFVAAVTVQQLVSELSPRLSLLDSALAVALLQQALFSSILEKFSFWKEL